MAWGRRKQTIEPVAPGTVLEDDARPEPGAFVPIATPDRRTVLEDHLQRFLGSPVGVWQEAMADGGELDIVIWAPTAQRPMFTLVTRGVSDRPMDVPRRSAASPFVELVICLPPTWPMPYEADNPWARADEASFPIAWLARMGALARQGPALGFGRSVPNGEPEAPFVPFTRLCAWTLLPPVTLPDAAWSVPVHGDERIDLFALVALHPDELERLLVLGVESLYDAFDEAGVTELLDVGRSSSLR